MGADQLANAVESGLLKEVICDAEAQVRLANMLNSTARLLRRYEQGITRPTGPVLRLLHAIREQGIERVFP